MIGMGFSSITPSFQYSELFYYNFKLLDNFFPIFTP